MYLGVVLRTRFQRSRLLLISVPEILGAQDAGGYETRGRMSRHEPEPGTLAIPYQCLAGLFGDAWLAPHSDSFKTHPGPAAAVA